ncbi:MAG TPA: DUF6549 family protein [Chitinophagaceae bacterium]|nr:DUF6549 family protein [Chitinophagaceae bacterium]
MTLERKIWIFVCLLLIAAGSYTFWRGAQIQKAYIAERKVSDSLRIWKGKDGAVHHEKEIVQIPADEYKDTQDSLIAELRKTVKAKDLLQHTVAVLQSQGAIKVPVHDTLYWPSFSDTPVLAKNFTYADSFLSLDGELYQNNVMLNYSVTNPIAITTKWQRPKWYKRKQLDVDIVTLNPHTTVGNVQSYVIKQPPKRFYETRAFAFAIGAAAGFLIAK